MGDKNKPVGVIIFAFVAIVLGALFLSRKTLPFYDHPDFTRTSRLIIWYISASCFLLSGIGMLLFKKWGKNIFMILMWLWSLNSLQRSPLFIRLTMENASNGASFIVLAIVFFFLIYFAFPIGAIYYFNRKSVKVLFTESPALTKLMNWLKSITK